MFYFWVFCGQFYNSNNPIKCLKIIKICLIQPRIKSISPHSGSHGTYPCRRIRLTPPPICGSRDTRSRTWSFRNSDTESGSQCSWRSSNRKGPHRCPDSVRDRPGCSASLRTVCALVCDVRASILPD